MKSFLISLFILMSHSLVLAEAQVGSTAPDFSVAAQDGKMYSLKDFKGKYLVLEWFNKDCPFVKKHYGANNMQTLQKNILNDKDLAKQNIKVAWLTVASSAEGKQGYLLPHQAKTQMKNFEMHSSALLLDTDGTMGHAYGATVTPHMFIIDPDGKVIYAGAIDSDPSSDPATIKTATNYITAAFDDIKAHRAIATSYKKPYGCGVKYK